MSLSVKNLSYNYGKVKAVDNLNFEIKKGEFVAILGPSGCGKTTLLRIIAGFIKPTSGSIICENEVFTNDKVNLDINKRDLSMVFQSLALWPHMNVKEHVEYPLKSRRYKSLTKEDKTLLVKNAIISTGLNELELRYPSELSGGQKQRVALARAIVGKPNLLLMDEPLSALDAELRTNMRKEIKAIHTLTKSTIIYVTHDQNEALSMADKIIVMKDGKIEQFDTTKNIFEKPKTIFCATFVSKCNLVKGTYENNIFSVNNSKEKYTFSELPECFIKEEVFPVRPEEFIITKDKDGISAIISSIEYNGREIHYKLDCNDDSFTVYCETNESYNIGEIVYLKRKC